jgi:hypothetical protein
MDRQSGDLPGAADLKIRQAIRKEEQDLLARDPPPLVRLLYHMATALNMKALFVQRALLSTKDAYSQTLRRQAG